jgi:carboxyl-terminal processing protease
MEIEPRDEASTQGQSLARGRAAWTVAFAALAGLAAYAAMASPPPRGADLRLSRTLGEITTHLRNDYVRELDEQDLRDATIRGMLLSATDRFTEYVPPVRSRSFENQIQGRFEGIGVTIEPVRLDDPDYDPRRPGEAAGGLRVVRPLPGSPAAMSGIRRGDRIVAVEGQDITGLPMRDIVDQILGPVGSRVNVTLERDPEDLEADIETLELDLLRASVRNPILNGMSLFDDGSPRFLIRPEDLPISASDLDADSLPRTAFVRIEEFAPGTALRVAEILKRLQDDGGLDGLIIDLRGNGGGLLDEAVALSDLFLDEGVIVWSEGANVPTQVRMARRDGFDGLSDGVSLVVLVDQNTASASEVFAGAVREHNRATIAGVRTFGKGSVQDVIPLSDGGRLKLTTALYHLPGGRVVHRLPESMTWGIEPDVPSAINRINPGGRGGPAWPNQVWDAYQALLARIAVERTSKVDTLS